MKKILLSMIMLCTAVSAWSYETNNVVLQFENHDESGKTTDSGTGISVQATPYTDDVYVYMSAWKVDGNNTLELSVPQGYAITGVKFVNSSFFESDYSIDKCNYLIFNNDNENGTWVQKDGKLDYFSTITFNATEPAYIQSVIVSYHKHEFTHNDVVAATCSATGMNEYWECSDCGKKYFDSEGKTEVTNDNDLILEKDNNMHVNTEHVEGRLATCVMTGISEHWACECGLCFKDPSCTEVFTPETPIDPKNHECGLTKYEAEPATCQKDGSVQYWHCDLCNKNFGDEQGQGDEITDVTIPKEQGSHLNIASVAQKAATCTESGVAMNHWHCSDCRKNFEDEACTTPITTEVVIPAINHKNKSFTEYVAPTTEAEGNVAYWYCPDCVKHFEDASCTKELTEWILEKLVNMMHFCFDTTNSLVPIETEHYMNTAKLNFTDNGDVILTVNGEPVTYDKGIIDKVKFSNGTPTVTISANEDPGKGVYYSTFYSNLESYAVPEGFTAYRGEISDDGEKLNLTSVEVMSRGKGYILRGTAKSGSMSVTENTDGDGSDNVLLGTDVAIDALGASDYALSLGQNGVGFYLWNGKAIGANKAYLTLSSDAKTLTFEFDVPTGIEEVQGSKFNVQGPSYNLNGMRVGDNYKGIVIKNGKKIYQR